MDSNTVFTKTAKGVTQVNQRTQSLSRDLTRVLKAIDGKSTVAQLAVKTEMTVLAVGKALAQLQRDSFTKIFEIKVEIPLTDFGGDDDFDFTPVSKLGPASANSSASFGPSPFQRAASLANQVEHATPAVVALPKVNDGQLSAARAQAKAEGERMQAEATRVQAEIQRARQLEVQKAQAEARARAEREAELYARLEVETRARKEAELRAMEEAQRAQAAAEAARKSLEAKLIEEKQQRDSMADTRARLTREQVERESEHQRALSAARAQAEAEAQALGRARVEAEAEAKALAAARMQTEAAAKRQAAEFETAQRDLRQQLKAEIEATVREEMETMLRSDINESARSEVEAAVLEEAQNEARRMLELRLDEERKTLSRASAQATERAEADARLMLAEQEIRIRAEMEARIATIADEKNRAEVEARKMAEVQAEAASKAAAEFAARLKIEEEARRAAEAEAQWQREAQQEIEARTRAEAEQKNRADIEARKNAEAQAEAASRQASELAERLKTEEEARRASEKQAKTQRETDARNRSRLEARAREELEERAKVEADLARKLVVEQEAKMKAQAQTLIQQELRQQDALKSQSELEAERRAREEAEKKAALESEGREIASRAAEEEVSRRERAEREAEETIAKERAARQRAEERARMDFEAEEMSRSAQVARLKELRVQNELVEQERLNEAKGKPKKRAPRKPRNWLRWIVTGGVALVAIAFAALQVMPLNQLSTRLETALAAWLHDDVSASNLRIALLPTPHLKVEQIALGKLLDAKGGSGKFRMDLASLFGDKFVVESLEFQDVTIAPEAMPRALQWVDAKNRGSGMEIEKITLKNVKLAVPGVAIELFDADLQFDKQGALTRATARGGGGKWNLDVVPVPSVVQGDDVVGPPAPKMWIVDFSARGIALPIGTPIPVNSFAAKGTLIGNELLFPQFDAQLLEGSIVGSLNASWKDSVKFNSNFTAQKIRVNQLAEVFTRDVALTGKMGGEFSASGSAPTLGALLAKPSLLGNFKVVDGSISNADLVQAMRSPESGGRGGQSKFTELIGQLRLVDGVLHFEKMKLAGGVLLANGNVSVVNGSGALSGTINSEIRSTVAQDRAVFTISGNVARPLLKRPGERLVR
jgi:AsmA-like C-terminal region